MGSQTVVADVADELARRVAVGEYQPGELMPSVRQVAEEFSMNRATAQLTLGRLESYGFVEARRGKGFTIRDVRALGGVDMHRMLFRFSISMPSVASEMFHDIVDLERDLVLDALLTYTEHASEFDNGALKDAVDRMEVLARQEVPDLRAVLAIEVDLVRELLTALGSGMRRSVLNSLGALLLEVPEAVQAFFAGAPDLHVLVWRALFAVWDSQAGPSEAQVALFEDLFGMYHERVLVRFDELVGMPREQSSMRAVTA